MHDTEHTRTATEAQPERHFPARYHRAIYERPDGVDADWGGRAPFDSLVDIELDGDEEPAL